MSTNSRGWWDYVPRTAQVASPVAGGLNAGSEMAAREPGKLVLSTIAGSSVTKAMMRISPPHRAQRKGKTS